MAACNYGDVIDQLRNAGLIIDAIEFGRVMRCRVEGSREKRGWYALHEIQTQTGDQLIVGTFGVWQGNDNGAQKIEIRKSELTREQQAAIRRRMAEDRKRAEHERQANAERAALRAADAWSKCSPTGDADYLAAKGVGVHGIRFSKSGAIVIPLLDTTGRIHGLQAIRTKAQAEGRPAKQFWPAGVAKKGHFHLIGVPTWIVLIAEGYATAASLHEATGLPTAVAFDAGNIGPVAAALHKRYRTARILICADDDSLQKCRACHARLVLGDHPSECPACGAEHLAANAGILAASAAALETGGAWIAPTFADEDRRRARFLDRGTKITDFNDLHAAEGLHVVRTQIETRLTELGWRMPTRGASSLATGGRGAALAPIESLYELLERFALVYGQGGTVFDRSEHMLLSLQDLGHACAGRGVFKSWQEHPDRTIVRMREVGFDPSETDTEITCNLWGGWPTKSEPGKCEFLIELLRYMCSAESNPKNLFDWVIRWIAYPIQHPGAKMKTTLVLHGPQGTGKNLFFEAVMSIYGQYGRVIDQNAIEDKFNDWASRKLFLIADEVVARSDLYHVKNKLKAFITGDWIRINPKNIAPYDERNHVNVVFLSNEAMPVVLEEDDRRHAVIWTPKKHHPDFYKGVLLEIANGGIAALHDYLLGLDLGEFGPGTLPPQTEAKFELVTLSLDSPISWYYALKKGDIGKMPFGPCRSEDAYLCYRLWCARTGDRILNQPRFINQLARKQGVQNVRKRYYLGAAQAMGPHGILMLGNPEPPPGADEQEWLGDHIAAFSNALSDLRQGVMQ